MSFFNPFRSAKKAAPAGAGSAGEPLELISYDTSNGHFKLGHKALQILRDVSPMAPNADAGTKLRIGNGIGIQCQPMSHMGSCTC